MALGTRLRHVDRIELEKRWGELELIGSVDSAFIARDVCKTFARVSGSGMLSVERSGAVKVR